MFLSRRLFAALAAPAVLSAALALAPAAAAEEIVLASGTRYQASDVQFPDAGHVRFTYRVDGGSATLSMPIDRLDPWSALALRAARVKPDDAKGQMALGRFALERKLFTEAARRMRKAALIDPSLAFERDAGLAEVREAELAVKLDGALSDLKRGRGDLALSTAKDVLTGAPAGSVVAQRAQSLVDLASSVAERDRALKEAEEKARAAAVAAAEKAAFESDLGRADESIKAAVLKRSKAADPNLSSSEASDLLERAEAQFREGRRLLGNALLRAGTRRAEVEARDREALSLLVATHVDLADLLRQQRRFDRARDRIRAALLLDPENVRARETRDLIEADLHAPPPNPYPYDDPYPAPVVVIPSVFTRGGYYSPRIVPGPSCDGGPRVSFGYRTRRWGFSFRW